MNTREKYPRNVLREATLPEPHKVYLLYDLPFTNQKFILSQETRMKYKWPVIGMIIVFILIIDFCCLLSILNILFSN